MHDETKIKRNVGSSGLLKECPRWPATSGEGENDVEEKPGRRRKRRLEGGTRRWGDSHQNSNWALFSRSTSVPLHTA